jgi:hypothetical protein
MTSGIQNQRVQVILLHILLVLVTLLHTQSLTLRAIQRVILLVILRHIRLHIHHRIRLVLAILNLTHLVIRSVIQNLTHRHIHQAQVRVLVRHRATQRAILHLTLLHILLVILHLIHRVLLILHHTLLVILNLIPLHIHRVILNLIHRPIHRAILHPTPLAHRILLAVLSYLRTRKISCGWIRMTSCGR